jgi:GTPase SAR1 family protein/3',5'-cyclic AMP phosphodiesterase CpdA
MESSRKRVSKEVEDKIKEAEEKNLTTLGLSFNNLTEIPDSITRLQNLTMLDLRYNNITKIPDNITRLQNLTELDLSENNITKIPDSITRLQNLTELDLSENNITKIPDSITRLQKLTTLYLRNNNLTEIPDSITRLQNLTTLNLSVNNLAEIPESITRLQNLTALYLRGNKLTKIPDISRLQNLTTLDLRNNPIEIPPPEVVKNGIKAIKDYFRQLQAEGEDRIYEAKLLIVGEPGAGKTTLAKKIENENYILNPDEGSTKGIDIVRWDFKMENGQDFRVNIWDFGGQQIYHATHQFFLTKRSLYALVADIRREDDHLFYWLNAVELLSDNSPLLIIKNEMQNRKREINERYLRSQFTNLKEVYATNLATKRGLPEIKDAIKFYIKNLPIVGTPLPKTWVKVRETLEKDDRNYISLEEYMKICEDNGFKQDNDKLQLSGYLHDLGICLHFQDDPILRKTVILKPEWGTDAVYRVLDDKGIIDNLGRFNHNDLASIWSEPKYANMHAELLQLMLNFKLCYRLPGKDNTYIAPQLLTEDQPEYPWDENENLIIRYFYEFMPKGMLTRFIVAMHTYIADEKYVWRTGSILERDKTRAEVIEYYDRRDINVRIVGMHKKELMTLITDELDRIHDSFNRLKYKKLIQCNCSECWNNQEPNFFEFETLRRYLENRRNKIQCPKSFQNVDVRKLIDDVFGQKRDTEEEPKPTNKPEPQKADTISSTSSTGEPIRILHLSDLHFGEDDDVQTSLQPLIADLQNGDGEQWTHIKRFDHLVISGDFTKKAKKEEFEKAKEFVSSLAGEFGLDPKCCILIPGNHDQSWDEQVYEWKSERAVDKSKLKDGFFQPQGEGYLVRNDVWYPNRFNGFSEYLYQPLIGSPYPHNFEDQTRIHLDNTGILFLALNSCWEVDEYFQDRSSIHEGALSRSLTEVSKKSPLFQIALWHHPLSGEGYIKDQAFLEKIRNANFKIILHGHIHEERDELLYYLHQKNVHVVGAGTFGALTEDRPESTPCLYNLLEVDPDYSKVRIHRRSRPKKGGAWRPYYMDATQGKPYYDITFS